MKQHDPHPFSEIFPMMEAPDRENLKNSIIAHGLGENIVLHEGKILDGRNREEVCFETGTTPRYIDWENLPKEKRGPNPLTFVMMVNNDRRQLTASQRAAVAAEAAPFFKELQKTLSAPKGAAMDEHDQSSGVKAEDESQAPGRRGRKSEGGKATAKAAKKFNVSPRHVERAIALKKKSPKKFAKVKAGKLSLTKAEKDDKKKKAEQTKHDEALKRVNTISGKAMADAAKGGKILKGKKELYEYTGMSDADMLKTRGLISAGWTVKAARRFKMTALTLKHTISDLCTRAIAQGVAKQGTFTLPVTHSDVKLEITVKAG